MDLTILTKTHKNILKLLIISSITFYIIYYLVPTFNYSQHFFNYKKNIQSDKLNIPPAPTENQRQYLVSRSFYDRKSDGFLRPNINNTLTNNFSENKGFEYTNLDFDEYFEDRILLQREWIANFSRSANFSKLKPKKIFVDGGFKAYYQNGSLNCPKEALGWESKCILIESKDDYYTTPNKSFDAVTEVRSWPRGPRERILPDSKLKQIFFIMESPFSTQKVDLSLNNAFLASYWRGSDIPIPYGKWFPQQQQNSSLTLSKRNYAKGKTKLVAILVSNCAPQNLRMEYVRQLQLHIQVDIYGKCGTFKCENCLQNFKKEYKFYLAFENANCRDYITEKFFENALQNDMVPVALGAHKKDYLYAAPPNSFIHVEDFDSPKELAEYLKAVDRNDTKYNEFFEWKSKGIVVLHQINDFFCRSCAALHIADIAPPPKWPQGITFDAVNLCLPPKKWYWDRDE